MKPDKINEILNEMNMPLSVKAVMIKNIKVGIDKLQLIHLFTTKKLLDLFDSSLTFGESPISICLEELIVIAGPSMKYMNNH